ncbi:DUF3558 domain-containing protein [Actinophytocola glycyrrhizae]|uniref:DUF3558 domain-containing protein n=1 Tax=Actinophytocola glycyrrhizae TaxID=2044873 RepID=A0ABV9RSL8_9PSEU
MLVRRSLLATGLLGLALVSACTQISEGEPRAATAEAPTSTSAPNTTGNGGDEELPFAGAPKVDNPLDTSRYEQDPCQSLTADQAQSLNLPPTGTINNDVALGIGCDWFNEETRGEVTIAFIVDDPRGLSPEYEANEAGKWKIFEELPDIEGYPAIIRSLSDTRELGDCSVLVGVADDMVFASNLQLSQANVGKKDPCEVAVQVAGMALQTMKAGA